MADLPDLPDLPEQFLELEPFLEWALPSERARSAKRQATAFADLQTFYDAMLARIEEILAVLDRYPAGGAPADIERLFLLTLSLAEVAPAVEFFGQPAVVDGYDASRFTPIEIYRREEASK